MLSHSLMAIFRKELKLFFNTPVAFIATVIFLLFVGWFFNSTLFLQNAATMRTLFDITPFAFLFFIPALTMKLFSEELKSGTYDLMASKPVTISHIISGKFLATLMVLAVFIAPTLLYLLTMSMMAPLDWGPVIGGYLGLVFLGSVYIAIGLYASSLTENQIVAFILAFIMSFFFYIIDKISVFFPGVMSTLLQYMSVDFHFQAINKGVIDTRDIIYTLSMICVFHILTYLNLSKRKGDVK